VITQYHVSLVTRDPNDLVTEAAVGSYATMAAAQKAAKRAAGRSARWHRAGVSGYRGPNGLAAIISHATCRRSCR
jgi:hypothetical protein